MISPFVARTGAGMRFDYEAPAPDMISLDDIVHRLSRLNGWDGDFEPTSYSLAQHSLVVASALRLVSARPYALLRCAPKAYLGERPIEATLWEITQGADIIARGQRILYEAVFPRFGLDHPSKAIIDEVDRATQQVLATEYRDLVRGKPADWRPTGRELPTRITFTPQPKVEEQFRKALEGALRPFGKLAA